jgi:hypothetical protein
MARAEPNFLCYDRRPSIRLAAVRPATPAALRPVSENRDKCSGSVAEREGFEPSIRFWRILTFQASAFDHSATAPHARSAPAALAAPAGRGKRRALARVAATIQPATLRCLRVRVRLAGRGSPGAGRQSLSANSASTSTIAPRGRAATPTAARACCPAAPNTACIRSDAPLATRG